MILSLSCLPHQIPTGPAQLWEPIAHFKALLTYFYFHFPVYLGFPNGPSKLCSAYTLKGIATHLYVTWERTEAL